MPLNRLPLGQVTPVARPIGAFVQPGQPQPAAPARPSPLGAPSTIRTIQTQGSGSVAGSNSYQQLATALAAFSPALTKVLVTYGKAQKDRAYLEGQAAYLEAGNQLVKGKLALQEQEEIGAADAAKTIGELQKRDPIAADLLREANPWKLAGYRRAVAERAGLSISSALQDHLLANQGQISLWKPEDPRITAGIADVVSGQLERFGLTGDEPQFLTYTLPAINKGEEGYRTAQRRLHNAEIANNTTKEITKTVASIISGYLANGVIDDEGKHHYPGTPEFFSIAQRRLTNYIDDRMTLLSPADKSRTLNFMITNLFGSDLVRSNPDAIKLLEGVKTGNAAHPYETRPTWGQAAPVDLHAARVRGGQLEQQEYELEQSDHQQFLLDVWTSEDLLQGERGPGLERPGTPEYQRKLQMFRQLGLQRGYKDIDGLIDRLESSQVNVATATGYDPGAIRLFNYSVATAPPDFWRDPSNVQELVIEAHQIAANNPSVEGQGRDLGQMLSAIEQGRAASSRADPYIEELADGRVLEFLDVPEVREIKEAQRSTGEAQGDPAAEAIARLQAGDNPVTAIAAAYQNIKLTRAANDFSNLLKREVYKARDAWLTNNPGAQLGPAEKAQIVDDVFNNISQHPEYERIIQELTGGQVTTPDGQAGAGQAKPGQPNAARPGAMTDAAKKDAAWFRRASASMSDWQVRDYQNTPVMNANWLYEEVVNLATGKPVSIELYNMAKRANTSVYRMLYEQLKFYPKMDPEGKTRADLLREITKQRNNNTVSSSQLPAVLRDGQANPTGPGGWLIGMLTPPAVAATLPSTVDSMPNNGYAPSGQTPDTAKVSPDDAAQIAPLLVAAIGGHESGGRPDEYTVLNESLGPEVPDSQRAIGKFQVMPYNIGPWTKTYLGYEMTPEQYRNSPEAQEKVALGHIGTMLWHQLKAGYPLGEAVRRVASIWYSGHGDLYDRTSPERGGPPIREYTLDILRRFRALGG